jgi:hypothetical protein
MNKDHTWINYGVHFIDLYLVIQIVLQYILYELDLKWDLFIGYSRHFNSRCAHIAYVVGWENLLRADLWMNFIVISHTSNQLSIILFIATLWMKFIIMSHAYK